MGIAGQLGTLAAVGVGGLVSWCATWSNERIRRKRELGAFWASQRLEVYRAYGLAVGELAGAATRLAADRALMNGPIPTPAPQSDAEIAAADRTVALAYEEVHLIGDGPVAASARALRVAAWELTDSAQGLVAADAQQWRESYDRYRHARAAFQVAARTSLAVPGAPHDRRPNDSHSSQLPRPSRPNVSGTP